MVSKPIAKTKLRISNKRSLEIIVWEDGEDVTKLFNKKTPKEERRQFKDGYGIIGFCQYDSNTGQAQIHLSRYNIGSGLWAHELQHFMYRELIFRLSRGDSHKGDVLNERLAKLCGRLTTEFWGWFYSTL